MRSQPGFWQTLSRVQVSSTISVKTILSRRASAPSTPQISGAQSARPSLLKAMVRCASFDTRLSSLSAFCSVMPPDCTDKRWRSASRMLRVRRRSPSVTGSFCKSNWWLTSQVWSCSGVRNSSCHPRPKLVFRNACTSSKEPGAGLASSGFQSESLCILIFPYLQNQSFSLDSREAYHAFIRVASMGKANVCNCLKIDRKKLIMTALWTEACLSFPALDALREGYEVYPVVDAVVGRGAWHWRPL